MAIAQEPPVIRIVRIGFFDGGSRGKPGAGGSGSVVVEYDHATDTCRPMWIVATSLIQPPTTKNVAEFVGLHRLLSRAAASEWTGIHIVGDSAMVLGLMQRKVPPKAPRLQHWYRLSRKLAEQCRVASWKHHYRAGNRMADWIANYGMDKGKRVVICAMDTADKHELYKGVDEKMKGDVGR
ncbi:hypothetical protein PC121_g17590 [Phytophthora cactorum]|nr:hypothetical protein PC121_g17590 [Phytophthora cactorum]